jgi:hypothetical protein
LSRFFAERRSNGGDASVAPATPSLIGSISGTKITVFGELSELLTTVFAGLVCKTFQSSSYQMGRASRYLTLERASTRLSSDSIDQETRGARADLIGD